MNDFYRVLSIIVTIFITGCEKIAILSSSEPSSGWAPIDACSYLDYSIKTSAYKNEYNNEYSCSSLNNEIGLTTSGRPNSLDYYASGKKKTVNTLKIVLNYNQANNADFATKILIDTSETLAMKATEQEIPPSVIQALSSGYSAIETRNGVQHEAKRINWSTGRGYEVHYIVTKPKT